MIDTGAATGADLATIAFWAIWGAVLIALGRSYWRSRNRFVAVAAITVGMLAIIAAVVL